MLQLLHRSYLNTISLSFGAYNSNSDVMMLNECSIVNRVVIFNRSLKEVRETVFVNIHYFRILLSLFIIFVFSFIFWIFYEIFILYYSNIHKLFENKWIFSYLIADSFDKRAMRFLIKAEDKFFQEKAEQAKKKKPKGNGKIYTDAIFKQDKNSKNENKQINQENNEERFNSEYAYPKTLLEALLWCIEIKVQFLKIIYIRENFSDNNAKINEKIEKLNQKLEKKEKELRSTMYVPTIEETCIKKQMVDIVDAYFFMKISRSVLLYLTFASSTAYLLSKILHTGFLNNLTTVVVSNVLTLLCLQNQSYNFNLLLVILQVCIYYAIYKIKINDDHVNLSINLYCVLMLFTLLRKQIYYLAIEEFDRLTNGTTQEQGKRYERIKNNSFFISKFIIQQLDCHFKPINGDPIVSIATLVKNNLYKQNQLVGVNGPKDLYKTIYQHYQNDYDQYIKKSANLEDDMDLKHNINKAKYEKYIPPNTPGFDFAYNPNSPVAHIFWNILDNAVVSLKDYLNQCTVKNSHFLDERIEYKERV